MVASRRRYSVLQASWLSVFIQETQIPNTLSGPTRHYLARRTQFLERHNKWHKIAAACWRCPSFLTYWILSNTLFLAKSLRKERKNKPKGFWQDANNRRQYFVHFAKEQGFDPSDAEAWKKVTWRKVQAKEVLAKNIQICINNTFENKREEAQFSFMDL